MARITKAEQALIPNVQVMMPSDLVSKLDQDEVADRVHYAKQLITKAAATTDPTLRQSWNKLAGAVLRTPLPREQVEKQVQDLRIKARMSWSKPAAEQLQDQADRFLADNPIAPRRQQAVRRQLAKAADAGQMACYDRDGNLIGTVDPSKLTFLVDANGKATSPDSQGAAAGQRDMGTSKTPPAAETPAANTPADVDDVTKAAPRLRGIVVRRPA